MKHSLRYIVWLNLISMIFYHTAYGLIVGSNTAVFRNAFFTFPAIDTDNEIRGFALMDEGFALENNSTTCLFNAIEPVRQKIFLNEGTLFLATNLVLENIATFTNLGSVRSTDNELKSLALAANTAILGADTIGTVTFENIELILGRNTILESSIVFSKTNRIIGNGHILTLGQVGNIIVDDDASLLLQNVGIVGLENQNIRCMNDNAQLVLNDVDWIQQDDFVFDIGSILFKSKVSFNGTFTFSYESAYSSTIDRESEWKLANNINLRIGRHPVSHVDQISFVDPTSVVKFDNATFNITSEGLLVTKGTAKFIRTVAFEFDSTSTSNGVIVGNNQADDDFFIEFEPAAVLNFNKGHFTYNDSIKTGLTSRSKTARVIRSELSNIFIAQNQDLSNFVFVLNSLLVPAPVVNTGKTLTFTNVGVELPSVSFDITAQQFSAVADLLRGTGDQVSITKGFFPLGLIVQNTGSTILGTGGIDGSIILSNAATQLNWNNLGVLSANIVFNGGLVTLNSDIALLDDGGFIGSGTIALNDKTVHLGILPFTQSTPLVVMGTGKLELNAKFNVASQLLFKGTCTIEGRRNILALQAGELVVDSNAHLILKDVILDGAADTNIRCIDDTGVITCDDVRLILSDNYTYTHGAFRFLNKNTINGAFNLAYQTVMTSTILAESQLTLDPGVTFSYDPPISEGSNKLLQFTDNSSELVLNGASLVTTVSGIELIKGTLRIKRASNISSDADINLFEKRGVSFGDGTNDFNIIIAPEIELRLIAGVLEYRNKFSSSLIMQNTLSAIRVATSANLQLFENLDVRPGFARFEDNALLYRAPGKNIIGSIDVIGSLIRGRFIP